MEQFISDSYAARAVEGFSWDNEIPGFGIRVYSTGKRSFIYRTTHGNHRLLKVIGRFPAISAEEARQIAKNLYLRELTSHGIPRARTFAELAHDYIELYAKVKKKSWMNDLYALDKHVLPYLKDRRIAEINKRDIEVLFARVSHKTPIAANRVLTLLRKMFALAIEWGELEKNPTTGIRKNHETSRDTFITRDQYPAFLRALEKETPEIQAIIKLLLLTGRRKSELLSAKWVDVDFDSRLLRAGSTKNKRRHYVALSAAALRVIEGLDRRSDYLFPGRYGSHRDDLKRAWIRVRNASKLSHINIHDLRRTLGSWLAQENVPLKLIGDVLNHTDIRATTVYARFQQKHLREALELQGKLVEGRGDDIKTPPEDYS